MEQLWFWIIVIVIMFVIELMTASFGFISFGIGGMAALAAYGLGASLLVQVIVFFIVSFIILIFIRPFVLKFLGGKEVERLNANIVIDKIAIVTEKISYNYPGAVKVQGKEWTAIVKDKGITFEAGEEVLVKDIEGVKLIVEKVENQ